MSMLPFIAMNIAHTGEPFNFGPSRRWTGYGSSYAGKANMVGGAGTDPEGSGEVFIQLLCIVLAIPLGIFVVLSILKGVFP